MAAGPGQFRDRAEAGRRLAEALRGRRDDRPVVLALLRGGVPVAAEVAKALDADFDVLLVRKLGHPRQPELALGAVGEGGVIALNQDIAHTVEPDVIETIAARKRDDLARRTEVFRALRPRVDVRGRDVIIVDDGAATGATMRTGIALARAGGARRVIVALPVAPADTVRALGRKADGVLCLTTPAWFGSVGEHYLRFDQLSDEDVVEVLRSVTSAQSCAEPSQRTDE